jgi:hypothetical protein
LKVDEADAFGRMPNQYQEGREPVTVTDLWKGKPLKVPRNPKSVVGVEPD